MGDAVDSISSLREKVLPALHKRFEFFLLHRALLQRANNLFQHTANRAPATGFELRPLDVYVCKKFTTAPPWRLYAAAYARITRSIIRRGSSPTVGKETEILKM